MTKAIKKDDCILPKVLNTDLPEDIKMEQEVKESMKKDEVSLSDLPGVGPATVEKLNMVGYNDLMSLAVATPGELIDATGMNQSSAKKIIAAARANLEMGFMSGGEVLKKRERVVRLSTGSRSFDDLN